MHKIEMRTIGFGATDFLFCLTAWRPGTLLLVVIVHGNCVCIRLQRGTPTFKSKTSIDKAPGKVPEKVAFSGAGIFPTYSSALIGKKPRNPGAGSVETAQSERLVSHISRTLCLYRQRLRGFYYCECPFVFYYSLLAARRPRIRFSM